MKITQRTWINAVTVLVTAAVLFLAVPDQYKTWAPAWMTSPKIHYGLDLAGGTQLDFRISERELEEQIAMKEREVSSTSGDAKLLAQAELDAFREQKANVTEAIRTVLERRINSLGVSEARITPAEFGGEKHLLVECPGVVDTQVCIDTVGKTIQLEFKEEYTEVPEEYEREITELANTVYAEVQAGKSVTQAGEEYSSELSVEHNPSVAVFEDQLPGGLEELWNRNPEDGPLFTRGQIEQPVQTADGFALETLDGYYIARVVEGKALAERTLFDPVKAMQTLADQNEAIEFSEGIEPSSSFPASVQTELLTAQPGQYIGAEVSDDSGEAYIVYVRDYTAAGQRMSARQILISHADAFRAPEGVTRTAVEAERLATTIRERAANGEDFAALAREFSDGPNAQNGGTQEEFGTTDKDAAYSQAAFALQNGQVSEVVETSFGYYVIQATSDPITTPDAVDYVLLTLNTVEDSSLSVTAVVEQLEDQQVTKQEEQITVEFIFFSTMPTGWKDTELDGTHFRSATVTLDEFNRPVVQINFDEEGGRLFQELTASNIGKQIAIFVGGQLVSAPNVQGEIAGGTAVITGTYSVEEARLLAQDLNTGAIPAPIYLSGQRTIEPTLGALALETSLKAALIGVLILMVYMMFAYRLLGLLADLALACYALILFALLKLPLFLFSDQYIVLSLAGMAGIILSIGMAVDANVLIFERMREELRKGKLLKTAAETGFTRAWPSIRDGNVSTLITCSILFIIGTSIIRGFAITLGIGVLISMFSAIVITRFFLAKVAESPLAERKKLFVG